MNQQNSRNHQSQTQQTQGSINEQHKSTLKLRDNNYDIGGIHQDIIVHLNTFAQENLPPLKSKLDDLLKIKQYSFQEFYLQLWKHREKPEYGDYHLNDICTICQFPLFELEDEMVKNVKQIEIQHFFTEFQIVVALECDHLYHLPCLEQCLKDSHLQCAICTRIYGVKMGDQPDGVIQCHTEPNLRCDGYPDCGTIVIHYKMHGGFRNGQQFAGTTRTAYLPDCPEGREVFELLKVAFNRRLIFTVGRSVTSGLDHQTVWNGIHHKTRVYGGSSNFGWPDETYFSRVKQELASKGVM